MMSDREPTLLGSDGDVTAKVETPAMRPSQDRALTGAEPIELPELSPALKAPVELPKARTRRDAQAVYVVGFWRRLAAAVIDLAIVVPAALLITLLASKVGGVHLPPSNLRLLDVDMWIDLVLATDPALLMGMILMLAIGMIYLLVFQIVIGQTLGMRVLRLKIIDVYGERPSPARCAVRCVGYLASIATLFLGFLWMGFDSEKRALQDWIAGTYVIKA